MIDTEPNHNNVKLTFYANSYTKPVYKITFESTFNAQKRFLYV